MTKVYALPGHHRQHLHFTKSSQQNVCPTAKCLPDGGAIIAAHLCAPWSYVMVAAPTQPLIAHHLQRAATS
jgi:hypothetical protein